MRIIAFPNRRSAYTDALYHTVAPRVEVIEGDWSGRWLWANLRSDDVVHVHWPSVFYHTDDGALSACWKFIRFVLFFTVIKFRVHAIFWTAHNVLPHTRCVIPRLDVWVRAFMIKWAHRIFVHGPEAEKILKEKFPQAGNKVVQIPHGNWRRYYGESPTQTLARKRLGLPEKAFVFQLFGFCQPYKNIHGLVSAFISMAADDVDYLLISGQFSSETYREQVERLAAEHSNIRLDSRFIPNADVPTYIAACDVICVPYQEILTSGTAMLALTYGRPVLSIDRGFLRDAVPEFAGALIEPGDHEALVAGMLQLKQKTWSEKRIVRHAERFEFETAADIFCTELTLLGCDYIDFKHS